MVVSDSQNEQQSVYKAPLITVRQRSYCFHIFEENNLDSPPFFFSFFFSFLAKFNYSSDISGKEKMKNSFDVTLENNKEVTHTRSPSISIGWTFMSCFYICRKRNYSNNVNKIFQLFALHTVIEKIISCHQRSLTIHHVHKWSSWLMLETGESKSEPLFYMIAAWNFTLSTVFCFCH